MLSRRQFVSSGAAMIAAPILPRAAGAATFPDRPVRVMITVAPGGASGIVARLSSNLVSERLGQSFIVENRAGGGGVTATLATKSAPADGHTILAIARGNVLFNLFFGTKEFDFMRDFEPVAS